MSIRYAMAALPVVLMVALTNPAAAQQRVVVIPEGAAVAIPARGAVPVARRTPVDRQRLPRFSPPRDMQAEAAIPAAAVLVPVAVAAVLAATLSGGGGGSVSAPVRTR